MGTAVQSDWVNSHLAARLPAVVVSVEHRLLAPGTPLSAAVDDGWDVLGTWCGTPPVGIDPARTAVFGESAGALVAALAAISPGTGLPLRAQVLVNSAVDVTPAVSTTHRCRYADSPTLTGSADGRFLRLAVPQGTRSSGVVTAAGRRPERTGPSARGGADLDPVADHGRRTPNACAPPGRPRGSPNIPEQHTRSSACRAWFRRPKPARAEILEFLRDRLAR